MTYFVSITLRIIFSVDEQIRQICDGPLSKSNRIQLKFYDCHVSDNYMGNFSIIMNRSKDGLVSLSLVVSGNSSIFVIFFLGVKLPDSVHVCKLHTHIKRGIISRWHVDKMSGFRVTKF